MQRSKTTAILFLLGAVLVGGALGIAADRTMLRDQLRSPRPRQTLADRLRLNESQRAKVDSILDARKQQMDLVEAPIRDRLDSIRSAARDQIRLILSDEQRQEFEKILRDMNQPPKAKE